MVRTEAQMRAKKKCETAKVMRKVVKFCPCNEDLLAHLEKQPRQNAYTPELIRRDICE